MFGVLKRTKSARKLHQVCTPRRSSTPVLPLIPAHSETSSGIRDWLSHDDGEVSQPSLGTNEGENQEKDKTKKASAKGFLTVLDQEAERRFEKLSRTKAVRVPSTYASRPVVLSQIESLQTLFPDFPRNMMNAMIMREKGNCFRICNELLSKGWGSKELRQAHGFQDIEDIHFSVPYYHGVAPSDTKLQQMFQKASPGTFITYYRVHSRGLRYYIYFKNQQGKLVEKGSTYPVIPEIIRKGLELHRFITCKHPTLAAIPYFL